MSRPPAEFFVRTIASTWQLMPAPATNSEQKPATRRLRVNGHLPGELAVELPKDPRGSDYSIKDARIMVDEGIWLYKTSFKKDENWFAPRQGGIFLSDLSSSSDEQFLRDEFSRYGSLEQVRIHTLDCTATLMH